MHAYVLTGWLVTGAVPIGGVASAALGWALPVIAAVMLLLLAMLAADTACGRFSQPRRELGRTRLGGPRRATTFRSIGCASATR